MTSIDLAERIKALEGPCRSMDREIAKLVHGASWKMHADTHYTGSVDAAMSLAEGQKWPNDPLTTLCAALLSCPTGEAADLPRFICATALRATPTNGASE